MASGTSDTRVALGAISACPALFPCKNALPARNRLGVAQDLLCSYDPTEHFYQGSKMVILETLQNPKLNPEETVGKSQSLEWA